MEPVAVGGFHNDVIRLGDIAGVVDEGLVEVAHVARKDELFGDVLLGDPQLDARGPEQVARVDEPDGDPVAELLHLVVDIGFELGDRRLRVPHGVHRFDLLAPRALALAVFPLGLKLLDVRGVAQHDAAEVAGRVGRADRAAEAQLGQQGKAAGVVDVRVGQQHIVDFARREGDFLVLIFIGALLHAAVDQEFLPARLQIVTAAGDLVVRAQKRQLHNPNLPISFFSFYYNPDIRTRKRKRNE